MHIEQNKKALRRILDQGLRVSAFDQVLPGNENIQVFACDADKVLAGDMDELLSHGPVRYWAKR